MSLAPAVISRKEAVFKPVDWLSFGLTLSVMLAGYLFTLAPQVTLGFAGIFSTGAMYAGVPHPPGYPVWTIYAWLFTLLPVSNIAWRVALSSAVATSIACGLIALMVSRGGVEMAKSVTAFQSLSNKQKSAVQVVAGCVAGMAFGFDGGVWKNAVIADVWPLKLLLLCSVLCLLMRWFNEPARLRYLYLAFLIYGLTFCNSQALLTAAFGLQILVMFGDPTVGREIFFANGLVLLPLFLPLGLEEYLHAGHLAPLYFFILVASTVLWVGLVIRTPACLDRWRAALACGAMFVLGTTPYLYLPLASMTNPPMNWGYPRTVTGFFHVLTRGQYPLIHLADSVASFVKQMQIYGEITVSEFGLPFLVLALIPFCFLRRLEPRQRSWMLGLLAVYLCLVVFLMMLLNLAPGRANRDFGVVFSSASHIVPALWCGYGIILLASLLNRSRQPSIGITRSQSAPGRPDPEGE